MNYNHPQKGGSTIVTKTVCAATFVAFTFLWLYCFQADVLAVAQHVLSGGQTRYDRLVGALLITGGLWLLQLIVYSFTRLNKTFHALTFFPSMLVLAVITDISSDLHFTIGSWWWAAPLLTAVWLLLVLLGRGMQVIDEGSGKLFTRRTWVNLTIMCAMMAGVAVIGNTEAVFHFRARAETSLMSGNIDRALSVGSSSHESDANLTMLRVYALSRSGQLGDRLFHYPVVGGSDAMLPFGTVSRTLLYPADSIFRYLGAIPRQTMSTRHYLKRLEQDSLAKAPVADYMLCACLADRDLDTFARLIGRYYEVSDKLPRHYREALTLYTHMRSHPVVTWSDNVIEEDYADLQRLQSKYPDASERKVRVEEKYAGSYWYYYFFSSIVPSM